MTRQRRVKRGWIGWNALSLALTGCLSGGTLVEDDGDVPGDDDSSLASPTPGLSTPSATPWTPSLEPSLSPSHTPSPSTPEPTSSPTLSPTMTPETSTPVEPTPTATEPFGWTPWGDTPSPTLTPEPSLPPFTEVPATPTLPLETPSPAPATPTAQPEPPTSPPATPTIPPTFPPTPTVPPESIGNAPRNVILMVPDGMGLAVATAARVYLHGPDGDPLAFEGLSQVGSQRTYSVDSMVTDSAAGASAWASGAKFRNTELSCHDDNFDRLCDEPVTPTVLEVFAAQGKATGLVATSTITHATPAAFGSHVFERNCEAEVARQYLYQSQVDVLLGGGWDKFDGNDTTLPDPSGTTSSGCTGLTGTGLNLLEAAPGLGYTLVTQRESLDDAVTQALAGQRMLLGLFAPGNLTPEYYRNESTTHEPHLSELTQAALEVLEQDDQGFFLMVEGSQIDTANHSENQAYQLGETLEFHHAAQTVLDWIYASGHLERREQTLLVVVADHDTGGFVVEGPDGTRAEQGSLVIPGWSFNSSTSPTTNASHTGEDTVIWSQGPGSALLGGNVENTFLYEVMTGKVTAPPRPLETPATEARRVILMVPAGMGVAELAAARSYLGGAGGGHLHLEDLSQRGYQRTHSLDSTVTDPAAGASAWVTGEKHHLGELGCHDDDLDGDCDEAAPYGLIERVRQAGFALGLVSSGSLSMAPTAAFGARAGQAGCEADVAWQVLMETGVEVLLGGGEDKFDGDPETGPDPGLEASSLDCSLRLHAGIDLRTEALGLGYALVGDREELAGVGEATRLLGLFAPAALTPAWQRTTASLEPSLWEQTSAALEALERGGSGYLLVVTGAQIAEANAQENLSYQLGEVLAFDEAVGGVLGWLEAQPGRLEETLLVVVSERAVGGFAIHGPYGAPAKAGQPVVAGWSTLLGSSTGMSRAAAVGDDTLIFSQGPGSQWLGGLVDNTQLYHVLDTVLPGGE